MDIKQLQRFLDLCETKSFTKTAENLYLSQQALSSSINALEEELGKALFRRTPKGVVLTEEGNVLRELSSPLVDHFQEMTVELARRFDHQQGHVFFSLAPGVLRASSPDLLFRFRTTYPNIKLKAVEGSDSACLEQMLNDTVELAFCPRPQNNLHTEYIHLRGERLYAVINKASPLAKKRTISIADLREEKLVSLNKHYQIRENIVSCCKLYGFTPEFMVESGESGILLSMVTLNQCVFICMEYLTMDMDEATCVKIPLSDTDLMWEYGLVYKKGKKLEYGARKFIEFLIQNNLPE